MGRFVVKVAWFSIVAFIIANVAILVLPHVRSEINTADIIFNVIALSKRANQAKVVIVGDSVARQMLAECRNPNWNNLTCNDAISLAGQYTLICNAVNNNPQINKIVLVLHPASFINNLDQIFTFTYFCKPFYEYSNHHLWTDAVQESLSGKPVWLAFIPIIKYTNLCGDISFSNGNDYLYSDTAYISLVSYDYLLKIDSLSTSRNIECIVLAPPISNWRHDRWEEMSSRIDSMNLSKLFEFYPQSIVVLDDSIFTDHTHLMPEYLPFFQQRFTNMLDSVLAMNIHDERGEEPLRQRNDRDTRSQSR